MDRHSTNQEVYSQDMANTTGLFECSRKGFAAAKPLSKSMDFEDHLSVFNLFWFMFIRGKPMGWWFLLPQTLGEDESQFDEYVLKETG